MKGRETGGAEGKSALLQDSYRATGKTTRADFTRGKIHTKIRRERQG